MKTLAPRRISAFDVVNILVMVLVIFACLYPFWHTLIGSFNEGRDYIRGGVYIWPRQFTLENYRLIVADNDLWQAYIVTIARAVVGTTLHLLVTTTFAYGFSRRDLMGKKFYAAFCIIPIFFTGGLIPTFMVMKSLHLIDSFWVYIFPRIFAFWNVLIISAFLRTIPESLNESARMDGAGEYLIFFRIIVPLAKPVIMVILLFEGVRHWNLFLDSLVYIPTREGLRSLQHYLMIIITRAQTIAMDNSMDAMLMSDVTLHSDTVKMATMMVTSLPIIMVYPFIQKHFAKGVMIGSIKG